MRICQIGALLVLIVLGAATQPPSALCAPKTHHIASIPLPKRATLQPDGSYLSPRGFRKTLLYFKRYLKRQKQPFQEIPTYQRRGILIARLLSKSPTSPWLAIHIYKEHGKTKLFIVPRPKKSAPSSTQPPEKPPTP